MDAGRWLADTERSEKAGRFANEDSVGGVSAAVGEISRCVISFSLHDEFDHADKALKTGSVSLIVDDLQNLIDYIKQHTDLDDNPLGGLVEKNLLRKWAELEDYGKALSVEVNYTDTSFSDLV